MANSVRILPGENYPRILTGEALSFLESLVTRFGPKRLELLVRRKERRVHVGEGGLPDFRFDTESIRKAEWKVAAIPQDLQDRRVEITGPVERKMVINALNSGARVFMGDLEDSLSPTWERIMEGQETLYDWARDKLDYTSPEGKHYAVGTNPAVLIVRPRGWHLEEKHLEMSGQPLPASLVDFALFLFHNAKPLMESGKRPYFYLPKLEAYEEALLWADVIAFSEKELGLPHGTVRVTVLIETILAAFEMEEILYALRDYCTGLNCGRWDYIFSFVKLFHTRADFVLPDRAQVTMTTHFLRSYSRLLIDTCHRRGAFAMGGMSAFIPVKNDETANEKAFAAVRADKEREAADGHDGTWVAHPGLVPVAMEVFNRHLKGNN